MALGREWQAPAEGAAAPRREGGAEGGAREDGAKEGGAREPGGGLRSYFAGNEAPEQNARRPLTPTQRRVLGFTWLGVFSMLIYALFIGLAFFSPGYRFIDGIAAFFLVLAILFILMHGLGYANSMIKASWGYNEMKRRAFAPQRAPKVACIVACYNEPGAVLEETVAAVSNLDYPDKEIVILDDSTNEESRLAAEDIARRYNVALRRRTNRRGYKGGAINDFLPTTDAPYVAIFDADALPAHNFLRDLVPVVDENPRLAFVQTPQYYANTDASAVAVAASRQQAVFYEYICEGKSHSRAAFCCGTNVIFRREALLDVKGFDEGSVTEDFATSLNLHMKNYDSAYYNQVYAYSLAPETLGAYFTQQSRWAFGSVGSLGKVIKSLFTHPGALRGGQWWEYFLSASYYWIGWVNFTFMLLPMLYIFFGIQPLRADVFTYLAVFIPYILFTMNMFYAGMEQRGYGVGDMLLGQQINFLCFPIHMSAALSGILGRKRPFGVTPKTSGGGSLNWLSLWPQLLLLVLSAFAFVWGTYRYVSGQDRNTSAIAINSLWALYHVFLLSGIFRLNRPVRHTQDQAYFSPSTGQAATATETGAAATANAATANAGAVRAPSRLGRFSPRAISPLRHTAPPGLLGHMALGIMALSLIVLGASVWTMISWATRAAYPVNVYALDRTTGRDYQEHRALMWTLNFLKVRKQPNVVAPNGAGGGAGYNFAQDFYGFVPGNADQAVPDPLHQGDLLVRGDNRPLPDRLEAPGALFLADSYGEFVEYDYSKNKYVRYTSQPRGILPAEVDRIQDFYNRNGLLIGEWNTLGYPTLPAQQVSSESVLTAIAKLQKDLAFYRDKELPPREAQLKEAIRVSNETWRAEMERQIIQTKDAMRQATRYISIFQSQLAKNATLETQFAAQRRLEKMLHVHYLGWYGRYVDKFENEREYDFRLWKNVVDYIRRDPELKKQFPNGEPRGPGFVFYHDGPSEIVDPENPVKPDGKPNLQPNPFSQPVVIFQSELGEGETNRLAAIYKNQKAGVKDDPLLEGVADEVPCRFWFDVVRPDPGSRVLAYYKLQVRDKALTRLRAAKFPAEYLSSKDGRAQIVFPAATAYREGDPAKGQLRSFYFAGDASDYPLVSKVAEMFPSTGGIFYFLGHRAGSFPTLYFWNYYQPMLKNIFEDTDRIRYKDKT